VSSAYITRRTRSVDPGGATVFKVGGQNVIRERNKIFVPPHSKSGGTIFSLLSAMYSAIENSTVNVRTFVEILQSMVPAMRVIMFPTVERL